MLRELLDAWRGKDMLSQMVNELTEMLADGEAMFRAACEALFEGASAAERRARRSALATAACEAEEADAEEQHRRRLGRAELAGVVVVGDLLPGERAAVEGDLVDRAVEGK